MCLQQVFKQYPKKPLNKTVKGFKVFRPTGLGTGRRTIKGTVCASVTRKRLKVGKWRKSKKKQYFSYPCGFHIYKTLRAAKREASFYGKGFRYILPVIGRGILAYGRQAGYVWVTDELFIPKPKSKKK